MFFQILSLTIAPLSGHLILVILMTALLLGGSAYSMWEFVGNELVLGALNSPMSQGLSILTIWITIFMITASGSLAKNKQLLCLFLILMTTLSLTFKVNSVLLFYFLFETALIPIFLMIMGWGYQPERFSAGISMFLYTVLASLPLIISLIFLGTNWFVYGFSDLAKLTYLTNSLFSSSFWAALALIAGFLVKYPIFLVHLWLPKAHVEAPVAGSMILAALLLKLGGYGLIRVSMIIEHKSSFVTALMMFSLMGGALVSILCLRQTDTKILIAYSSVAHMSMAISATLTMTAAGLAGALLLMIAHGVTSSGMFSTANILYERWKSRNMLLSKSALNYLPIFSLWWFLLCMSNMAAPPSLSLISEILAIISLVNSSLLTLLPIFILASYAVAYTLILYSSTQQGQVSSKILSIPLSQRESVLMFSHAFAAFALSPLISLFV